MSITREEAYKQLKYCFDNKQQIKIVDGTWYFVEENTIKGIVPVKPILDFINQQTTPKELEETNQSISKAFDNIVQDYEMLKDLDIGFDKLKQSAEDHDTIYDLWKMFVNRSIVLDDSLDKIQALTKENEELKKDKTAESSEIERLKKYKEYTEGIIDYIDGDVTLSYNYVKQSVPQTHTIVHKNLDKLYSHIALLEQTVVEGNQNVQEKNYKLTKQLNDIREVVDSFETHNNLIDQTSNNMYRLNKLKSILGRE